MRRSGYADADFTAAHSHSHTAYRYSHSTYRYTYSTYANSRSAYTYPQTGNNASSGDGHTNARACRADCYPCSAHTNGQA